MIRFSLRNPLLVNLVLVLVIVMGVISWQAMPQEMFPTFDHDVIRIRTTFDGAAPEEIERQITIPIEEALDAQTDIDWVTSNSLEGVSMIHYRLQEGADTDEILREMRTEVDAIDDFPEDADTPIIVQLKNQLPVISVALHGEAPMPFLYDLAEQLRRKLLQIPGASGVSVTGERDWELWVQLDPHQLAARDISLDEIAGALRNNLRDTPSGTIRASEGDILLRGMGVEDIEEIRNVVVRSNPQGGQLHLRDLATVSLQLEEAETLGRFNSHPSVNMTIGKSARASTAEVAEQTRRLLAEHPLPAGVRASLFADMSVPIETRIHTVQASGVVALVLLLLSLYFLLNLRIAAITALGIPVAMLTAVIFMALGGYTINLVSMFAFLVVLGLVVDDAIIISENTYRHMEEGLEAHEAAYVGAREVLWPVIASIFTTVAAFIPIFGITGTIGKFVQVIPVVVVAALVGSLIEAFLILPSHTAEMLKLKRDASAERWHRFLDHYRRVLEWAVHNRYLVASLTIGTLMVTLSYAATRLSYVQFSDIEQGEFLVNVEAPITYGLQDSYRLAQEVEETMRTEVEPYELDSIQTNVGLSMIDFNRYTFGSNQVQFNVNLTKASPEGFIETYINPLVSMRFGQSGIRERSTEEIMDAMRERLKPIAGIQRLAFETTRAGPGGSDIEVGIIGPDLNQLQGHAEQLRDFLRRLPGVNDVRHDLEPGKIEYQYTLNDRGRELGLSQSDLGRAIRLGYEGERVLYISHGDRRIPVRLLYERPIRHDSASFDRQPLVTANGVVYLDEIADIRVTRGRASVNRRDGERMVTINGEVDDSVTSVGAVTRLIDQTFSSQINQRENYQLLHLGAKREARQGVADMKRAILIALVLIFFTLATLFRSLLDPVVVMIAIPFSLIGVVIGHALFGIHLQFLSLIGLLALAGVVVNDSLILINYVKQLRDRGHDRLEATLSGARTRFRPILLTTVTTFFGVSPLIFFSSGQTKFLAPMAISLGFGLVFATVLILLVLPCLYLIADDLRDWSGKHGLSLLRRVRSEK